MNKETINKTIETAKSWIIVNSQEPIDIKFGGIQKNKTVIILDNWEPDSFNREKIWTAFKAFADENNFIPKYHVYEQD